MRITITIYVPPPDISDLEIEIPYPEKADENSDNNNENPPDRVDNVVCFGPDGKVDEDAWHNFTYSEKVEE